MDCVDRVPVGVHFALRAIRARGFLAHVLVRVRQFRFELDADGLT